MRRCSSSMARRKSSGLTSPLNQLRGPLGRFCMSRNRRRFSSGASGPSRMRTVVSRASQAQPESKTNTVQRGSRRSLVEGMGPCAIPVRRLPGGHFGALARSILYQQLAGKAAFAIHGRFAALFEEGTPTAQAVAALPDTALRSAGLSGSKAASIRDLAERVVDGRLRLDDLPRRSDEQVVDRLVAVRGIGRWTAELFLIFTLGRLDVWRAGDYGVC